MYYIVLSIATNGFNYFAVGKRDWLNTAINAAFAALAPAIMIALQYITFVVTGEGLYVAISNIIGIWLFPIVVVLPVAVIVSRKIYRATKNPYIGGIIMGLLVSMMMASNTLTQL